ncbi:MAG TPA: ComEC/Rec2 family competence protein [Pyrinomonadaceae bacterium]|nr:ComEC/Rec2 family competence protein [Pyrinomonadaceae bacterium]
MAELPRMQLARAPLFVCAASLASGILIGHFLNADSSQFRIVLTLGLAVLLLLAIVFVRRHKHGASTVLVVAAFLLSGFLLSLIETRQLDPSRIKRMFDDNALAANEPVELTGVVKGPVQSALDGFYLIVRAESLRVRGSERAAAGDVLLLAHVSSPEVRHEYELLELRHGARLRVMTTLDRDEDYRNPGVLPFTEYLDRKGYDATGAIKSPLLVERLDDAPVFLPLAWLYEWREQLEAQFDKRFSPETAGVLDAVLLGNRYKISRSVADRFRAGGTFHVLVIAGLHISFIAGIVFLLMRRITRNRVIQFACAVTFLFAYSIMVGAQEPVLRAALVFSLGIFAPLVWRRANSLNVIAGAALALLVWRPNDLFDPSFQLTFLSVISIVAIAVPVLTRMQAVGSWRPTHETPYPPICPNWFRKLSEALFWSERAWKAEMAQSNVRYRLFKTRIAAKLEQWRLQRILRFAVSAIVVSASVQLGILPVLIIYFHRVSFASLFLNIFVGVTMAAIAFLALLAMIVAQLNSSVATPLVWIAEKLEWLMVHAVDPFNRFGVAAMRLPHYRGWLAAVYALYFVALAVLIVGFAGWNPLRSELIVRNSYRIISRRLLVKAALAFAILLTVVLLHPFSGARADGLLHVDFLDVGQGDSALITTPDGTTLLIDGGGRPNIDWNASDDAEPAFERDTGSIGERVVSEYLWSLGLDRVDYVLPTHADADHIDGLNDVARNFKVRGAIVARTPGDDSEYSRFAATMKKAGVPIERVGAGDVLRFGEVSAEVLWPPPSTDATRPYRNNDGLVLRVRYRDKTFLFLADIEKEAEAALLKSAADLNVDVVKVAHHGSRTSSIQPLVNATQPSLAIISVGRTSIFGHPHKEVVDRWRAIGAQVMTTGEKGTISVVTDGKKLVVSTFVP